MAARIHTGPAVENNVEKYMDNYGEYKRYTAKKCKCGCSQHCSHSCQDCEYCPDCECEQCLEGLGQN